MEIGHLLKTFSELFHFTHTNTCVLSEKSETFGANIKRIEIAEVFIDSVQWFLFRSSDEKNGSISTLDGVFLWRWLVVWGRVSYFDISNSEWGIQWLFYWFGSLGLTGCAPFRFTAFWLWGSSDWLWSSDDNWFWSSNDLFDGINISFMFWLSKVLIILLGQFFILILSELSSLNINKLCVVNSLNHSQVSWSDESLG